MSKIISNANIYKLAEATKTHVESGKTGLPSSVTLDDITYTWQDIMYVMPYAVNHLNNDCAIPTLKNPTSPWSGDKIEEQIKKDDFLKQATNITSFVANNGGLLPNYVTTIKSKKKVNANLYGYCFAKILVYYKNHNNMLIYTFECFQAFCLQ